MQTDVVKGDTTFEAVGTTEEVVKFQYTELTRREFRALVYHVLYTLEMVGYEDSVEAVIAMYNCGFDLDIPVDSDLTVLVKSIVEQRDQLDQAYLPLLENWRPERISIAARLILRYAVWELQQNETSATVIINEAVELAKSFADRDTYRFINGILDRYIKQ